MSDHTTTVKGFYDAFARGDVPTVLAGMDPKVEWHEAEHVTYWPGQAFTGPDAVAEGVFGRLGATFGDTFRVEAERVLDCGSVVVTEGRYKAVAQATGKELDVQFAHVFDFGNDGKVVRFRQYTDTWQFAEVTGQAPMA